MEIRALKTKQEMLTNYELLLEVYPNLKMEEYDRELDDMIPHNYGQVAVFIDNECVGLTGFWIGTKLWCGKYLELDNVVISSKKRSKGIGKVLFDYINKSFIYRNFNIILSIPKNYKVNIYFLI
jgi:hypothetical protein